MGIGFRKIVCVTAVIFGLGAMVFTRNAHPALSPWSANVDFVTPTQAGGTQKIAEASMDTYDKVTGAKIQIWPSADNVLRISSDQWSALKFFVAPIFVVAVPVNVAPLYQRNAAFVYALDVSTWHDAIESQARAYVVDQLASESKGQFSLATANRAVAALPIGPVTITFPDFVNVRVSPLGDASARASSIPRTLRLSVRVPAEDRIAFETELRGRSLRMQATYPYDVTTVSGTTFRYDASDLKKTDTFKEIHSGGGAFVNAQAVHSMLKDTADIKNLIVEGDAGLESGMLELAEKLFKGLLDDFPPVIKQLADAERIEAELAKGLGLNASDFKPITTMWQVSNDLQTVTDFKTANQKMQSYYNKENTGLTVAASAGFGPFSASASWSRSTEQVNAGFFSSQEEYRDFRQEHNIQAGQEPRITARGLGLVEKSQFEQHIDRLVRVSVFQRTAGSKAMSVTASLAPVDENFISSLATFRSDLERQIQAPRTWISQPIGNGAEPYSPADGKPASGSFESHGGTVTLFVSGGAWDSETEPLGATLVIDVLVDGRQRGSIPRISQDHRSHQTFVTFPLILTDLPAGRHTVTLSPGKKNGVQTLFNQHSYCSVTALEIK